MEEIEEKRKGEMIILFEAIIWSFFPVVAVLSFGKLPSIIAFGWTTLFAAIFFGLVVIYKKRWNELKNPLVWKYTALVSLFIGVLFYGFYFIGLSKTTPGNASIVALMEVFTSFVFFNILRKEKISKPYIIGALLMVFGALIVLYPKFSGVAVGDLLVLIATFFAPPGNLFSQKARKIASSETIMFIRSIISAPCIFLIAYVFGIHSTTEQLRISLPFLLINGIIIMGLSKILWVEAIHRMSVTKAIALNSMTPLLTLLLAFMILHQSPSVWQFVSLIPLLIGTLLLTDNLKLKSYEF